MEKKNKEILNKGRGESANEADRQEMLALFHNPGKEYGVKKQLLKELQSIEIDDSVVPNYKRIFSILWRKIEKQNTTNKTRNLNSFMKIVAALVIGLFVGFYVTSPNNSKEPVYYVVHSPKGSVSEMLLPDGSVIFLNAGSRIKYSVEGEKGIREVFLNGEAWFDVAKNEKKPFVVHTPYYKIIVTGTQFNVKAYETDNEVSATLEEGKIIVNSSENLKLEKEIVLQPGEQITFNKLSKTITVKEVNTKWFTSWKDNKLVFVNMELEEFVVILERKYGVDIEVENKKILDFHIDCTIKNESILEILNIMRKTLPISYEIIGQKIVIQSN
ncbi:MAG: FecR family protein [Bacteroidota bacterium]